MFLSQTHVAAGVNIPHLNISHFRDVYLFGIRRVKAFMPLKLRAESRYTLERRHNLRSVEKYVAAATARDALNLYGQGLWETHEGNSKK